MQDWAEGTITRNVPVGQGLHRLTVHVAPRVAAAFHRPGQYHWVRLAQAGEAPFAIASAPGADVFEYLVRRGGRVADAWTDLAPGRSLEVSLPEGAGFPLEAARGRALWLVGTGTGWAPLRSVLLAVARERSAYGPVRALWGVQSLEQLAFSEDFDTLRAHAVELVPTLSRAAAGWRGAVGYVQAHLGPPLPGEAVAFLCGQPEMVREVTARLATLGVPAERVYLNA